MIELKDVMPISFLKKEPFTGSYKGMRYRIEKSELPVSEDSDEKRTVLAVCIWPQPFCYDKTGEPDKTREIFDFNSEGLALAVEWLNTHYNNEKKRWTRE